MSRSAAVDQVVRTLGWLRRDLLPHAAWEEAWLYPHLDATTGTPWATRTLRFEHEQIRDLAAQLEGAFSSTDERWSLADAFRLVIALARLESVVSAHLAKEHWFIAPLLESPERELQHEGGAP